MGSLSGGISITSNRRRLLLQRGGKAPDQAMESFDNNGIDAEKFSSRSLLVGEGPHAAGNQHCSSAGPSSPSEYRGSKTAKKHTKKSHDDAARKWMLPSSDGYQTSYKTKDLPWDASKRHETPGTSSTNFIRPPQPDVVGSHSPTQLTKSRRTMEKKMTTVPLTEEEGDHDGISKNDEYDRVKTARRWMVESDEKYDDSRGPSASVLSDWSQPGDEFEDSRVNGFLPRGPPPPAAEGQRRPAMFSSLYPNLESLMRSRYYDGELAADEEERKRGGKDRSRSIDSAELLHPYRRERLEMLERAEQERREILGSSSLSGGVGAAALHRAEDYYGGSGSLGYHHQIGVGGGAILFPVRGALPLEYGGGSYAWTPGASQRLVPLSALPSSMARWAVAGVPRLSEFSSYLSPFQVEAMLAAETDWLRGPAAHQAHRLGAAFPPGAGAYPVLLPPSGASGIFGSGALGMFNRERYLQLLQEEERLAQKGKSFAGKDRPFSSNGGEDPAVLAPHEEILGLKQYHEEDEENETPEFQQSWKKMKTTTGGLLHAPRGSNEGVSSPSHQHYDDMRHREDRFGPPPPPVEEGIRPAANLERDGRSMMAVARLVEQFSATGTKEAPFPLKLHSILCNARFQSCVVWLPGGKAWKIFRTAAFEQHVIPCYFRHTKYASFMRQVNGWGFLRGQRQGDVSHNSYSHELFVRDNPELCLKMVRSGASKTAGGEAVSGVVKKRTKRKTKDDDAGKDDEEEVSKKAVDKEEQESPNPSSPSDQISVTEPSLPPSSAEEDDEGQVVQNELEEENFSVGHDGSDQEDDDGRSKKDKQEKVAISSSKDDILASRGLDGEEPSNPLSEDEILTNKKKKKRKKSSNKDIETDLPSRIQEGKRGSSVVNKTITESDDDNDRVGEEESGGSDDDSTSS